jgi:polysaccharide deacetylase family protein (PEP-CTERM system associated)
MKEKDRESLKCNDARIKSNVLSVDLEDYFMVSAFEDVVKREDWKRYESRIESNTYRLLEILDNVQTSFIDETSSTQNSPKATFFCLGWVAEQFPHLIREIHAQGHEIASHGYNHRMITSMSLEEFRKDVRKSKAILEDLIGERILGYRAPSYSITRQTLWALEILAEEGYLYDSSIFPIHHDRYGMPNAPRYPFFIEFDGSEIPFQLKEPKFLHEIDIAKIIAKKGSASDNANLTPRILSHISHDFLIEFPISTLRLFGLNIPIVGGGYFRLFPLWFTLWAVKRVPRNGNGPLIFYMHPWEIDPVQPKVSGVSLISRFRHYVNIKKTEDRLEKILRLIPFSAFCKILEASILNLNSDPKLFSEYEG